MSNFICPICRDTLVFSAGPAVTALFCGHVFHVHCIKRWVVGQKTCPSCRRPCINGGLKLFFETMDDSCDEDDSTVLKTLQAKYDSLLYEIHLKRENNLALSNEIARYRHQNELLRKELQSRVAEGEKCKLMLVSQANELTKNADQKKVQLSIISSITAERDALKLEVGELRNKVSKYQSLKNFLESNSEEFNDDDYNLLDAQSLRAVLSSFKKSLEATSESERRLKTQLKVLYFSVFKYRNENKCLREQLNLKCQIIKSMKRQSNDGANTSEADIIVIDSDRDDVHEDNPPPPPVRKSPEQKLEIMNPSKKIAAGNIAARDVASGTIPAGNVACRAIPAANIVAESVACGAITAGSIAGRTVCVKKYTPGNPNPYIIIGFPAASMRQNLKRKQDETNNCPNDLQTNYDGLGGHSRQDFPSAALKPCRIVTNQIKRRK